MGNSSLIPSQYSFPNYPSTSYDPLSSYVNSAEQNLLTAGSQNDLATINEQLQMQRLQTANSIRTAIEQAMHTMAQQAISFSNQIVSDEVSQTKKSLQNSEKAV